MAGNRESNSGDDATFETSHQAQMLAYDRLPATVRRAMSLAWINYAAEPCLEALVLRRATPQELVAGVQRTDLRSANKAFNYTIENLHSLQRGRNPRSDKKEKYMVTQLQAQTVEKERDDGWRVLPTRKTTFTKPTAMTIMLTIVNDTPSFQVIEADGTARPPKPGELQAWWEGA